MARNARTRHLAAIPLLLLVAFSVAEAGGHYPKDRGVYCCCSDMLNSCCVCTAKHTAGQLELLKTHKVYLSLCIHLSAQIMMTILIHNPTLLFLPPTQRQSLGAHWVVTAARKQWSVNRAPKARMQSGSTCAHHVQHAPVAGQH